MSNGPKVGSVCWFDLPVTDFEKAKTFYGELLGWKFAPMGEDYWMILVDESTIGGLRKAKGQRVPCDPPVMYFTVDKIDPAIDRAKNLGAEPVGERVDIGDDNGIFHWFHDHDKNLIALWASE